MDGHMELRVVSLCEGDYHLASVYVDKNGKPEFCYERESFGNTEAETVVELQAKVLAAFAKPVIQVVLREVQ